MSEPQRRFRLTVRARLTILYGTLFLIAGVALLTITWTLTNATLPSGAGVLVQAGSAGGAPEFSVEGPPPQVKDVLGSTAGGVTERDKVTRILVDSASVLRETTLQTLLVQGSIALVVVAFVTFGAGWFLSGRVLRPLHAMTETAQRLSRRTLDERINLGGPDDEMKELADTFDGMLDRLQASFDTERRFIGNASHELRTPLTIDRTLLELALDPRADPDQLRRTAEQLLENNQRTARLLDSLLLLAASDQPVRSDDPLDLDDAARRAVDGLDATSIAGLTIRTDLRPAGTRGDVGLLERVVGNLVDNAVAHNVEGGQVDVSTRTEGGDAVLVVTNDGPLLAPGVVAELTQPFRRLDQRTGEGRHVGLGLSIVASVVEHHGGTLQLVGRDGGGLEATVRLPSAGVEHHRQ